MGAGSIPARQSTLAMSVLCLVLIGDKMAKLSKPLSPQEIHIIYDAQKQNIDELKNAWKHVNRTINDAYRQDNLVLAKFQTRILALIFCAYAEATFSKLIHTPYGLNSREIAQIKNAQKKSIVRAWQECLKISTKKIASQKSNHIPNVKLEVNRLIKSYIEDPSLIRNKVAHGQWKVALNSDNTRINGDLTCEINNLTVVDLYRYRAAFDKLNDIMKDIIESPTKAHWKFYWGHINEFDIDQKNKKSWTISDKVESLKIKMNHYKSA